MVRVLRSVLCLPLIAVICGCLLAANPAPVSWDDLVDVDGNIFLKDGRGGKKLPTTNGPALYPSLSCDGTLLAYVRNSGVAPRYPDMESPEADQIWIVGTSGKLPPRLALESSASQDWRGLMNPVLSTDNRLLYFRYVFGNGTTLYVLDLSTGKLKRLLEGRRCHSHEVMCLGEHPGKLIIGEDRLMLGGGRIDLYWLLNRNGEYINIIGQDSSNVDMFKEYSGIPYGDR